MSDQEKTTKEDIFLWVIYFLLGLIVGIQIGILI